MNDNPTILHQPSEFGELPEIPPELPILPMTHILVFPYVVAPIIISDERRMAVINEALSERKMVGLFVQKPPREDGSRSLCETGTVVFLLKMFRLPDGSMGLMVQGLSRIHLHEIIQEQPYLKGRVSLIPEDMTRSVKIEALRREVIEVFQEIVSLSPFLPEELGQAISGLDHPGRLADLIVSNLKIDIAERQKILEKLDVESRLTLLLQYLTRERELLKLGNKIQSEVKNKLEDSQREYFLREQMKAIQKELGDKDERTVEIDELKEKIEKAGLSAEAKEAAEKELDRLSKMPPQAAEYTVSRTYLDWLVSLPWNTGTEDQLDIVKAKEILDADHYDLKDVK
ncbi:MAG TPA: endopeptidase La, partial [bacterium]|nr:endopeptidase La [bacterium]